MRKIIYNKFDKHDITALPKVLFSGRIIVINTAAEAEKAVDYLMSQKILGIDTETRPSFKKGQTHNVALLQVSTHDTCFLFRLNLTGITPAIIRLLEDPSIPKIGLSLRDDINSLHKRADFHPGNFIDLQKHSGQEPVQFQRLHRPDPADQEDGQPEGPCVDASRHGQDAQERGRALPLCIFSPLTTTVSLPITGQ